MGIRATKGVARAEVGRQAIFETAARMSYVSCSRAWTNSPSKVALRVDVKRTRWSVYVHKPTIVSCKRGGLDWRPSVLPKPHATSKVARVTNFAVTSLFGLFLSSIGVACDLTPRGGTQTSYSPAWCGQIKSGTSKDPFSGHIVSPPTLVA